MRLQCELLSLIFSVHCPFFQISDNFFLQRVNEHSFGDPFSNITIHNVCITSITNDTTFESKNYYLKDKRKRLS